jgi:hypothetical protein
VLGLSWQLHEDDHGGGLQVQPYAADLDLHDECSGPVRLLELPYDRWPLADRHVTVKNQCLFPGDSAAEFQDPAELAEDRYLLLRVPA